MLALDDHDLLFQAHPSSEPSPEQQEFLSDFSTDISYHLYVMSCGKFPPRGRQLCNDATSHKLVRNMTLKEVEILDNALHLMRLFHLRMVVHHPIVMETLYEV